MTASRAQTFQTFFRGGWGLTYVHERAYTRVHAETTTPLIKRLKRLWPARGRGRRRAGSTRVLPGRSAYG